jgi:hypothetical protein
MQNKLCPKTLQDQQVPHASFLILTQVTLFTVYSVAQHYSSWLALGASGHAGRLPGTLAPLGMELLVRISEINVLCSLVWAVNVKTPSNTVLNFLSDIKETGLY